jgi:ribonuclease HI
MTAPKSVPNKTIVSPFLQSWEPPMKGERTTHLDAGTLNLLKTAKKYNVNFAPIKLSEDLKEKLSAWSHIGKTKATPLNPAARCLIQNHPTKSVKDLTRVSLRLNKEINKVHIPVYFCHCDDCEQDRNQGCENPQKCAIEAQKHLNKITPKFQPNERNHNDNLTLTPRRKQKNREARNWNRNGSITFNPSTTTRNCLTEGFQIFADPTKVSDSPANRQNRAMGINLEDELTTIYTDGACENNGKANAKAGAGIWIAEGSDKNKAFRIPGNEQSNQIGELTAIIKALETTPNCTPLLIKSDSRYAIEGLTTHLEEWEDQGWIGIKNSAWFKRAAYLLRSRSAPTNFQWVKGHNNEIGNERSDELTKRGAEKDETDEFNLEVPERFDPQGAKLAKITQALAYKGIRNTKTRHQRKTTAKNIEKIKEDISLFSGQHEKEETIWNSTHKKSIRPKIGQFLYHAIHNTQKIGNYWTHINSMEERANCPTCNVEESMNHILTECPHPTRQQIWTLAKEVWPYSDQTWPPITLGTTLGCGLLTYREQDFPQGRPNQTTQGASRLLQIIWSEATHLIWSLRCKRVINNTHHTPTEIKNRWLKTINKRLADDKILATKIEHTEKAKSLVRATWEKALERRHPYLHPDWISREEAL